MKTQRGKQSIFFNKNVYVASSAAIVGQKEGEGPLKGYFDQVVEDPFFAMDTWEEMDASQYTEISEKAQKEIALCMYLLEHNLVLRDRYQAAAEG